jgi:rare lipoprotein A
MTTGRRLLSLRNGTMRFARLMRSTLVGLVLVGVAGCATDKPVGGGGGYKVGSPYQISGVWYYPKEDPFYDETGIASWYGEDFHGNATANGERYDMNALTAAHRTLPMPVVVRVTNLDNGRSLRLRMNDRGPFARGRIIDVSKRAAQLLGFQASGTARVRVQFEGRAELGAPPPEDEDQVAAGGVNAAPVTSVATSELAPPPGAATAVARPAPSEIRVASTAAMAPTASDGVDGVVTVVPVPARTQVWVQVGAFLTRGNADRLAQRLVYAGGARVTPSTNNGKPIYRVRFGPYATVEQADSMLNSVIEKGHNGVQIVVE